MYPTVCVLKVPKIIRAISFTPGEPQADLQPFPIDGRREFTVDPAADDFYRRLIDLRTNTKRRMKAASAVEHEHSTRHRWP